MLFYIICAIMFAVIVYSIYYTRQTRRLYQNWRNALLKDVLRIRNNGETIDKYIAILSAKES